MFYTFIVVTVVVVVFVSVSFSQNWQCTGCSQKSGP